MESVRVGYQGIAGAYSEGAAVDILKNHPKYKSNPHETVPFGSFAQLFKAVEGGDVDLGVIPIESNISGTLHSNYDLLLAHRTIYIAGEFFYHERHCLLGAPDAQLSDIREIRSHPYAFDQCRQHLSTRRELAADVRLTQADDTAGSAAYIRNVLNSADAAVAASAKSIAAIAGARAAKLYGLQVLAEGIEDEVNAATRYFVISRTPAVLSHHSPCKTSLVVSLKNVPGTLFKALSCFALRDINVAKIESRPSVKTAEVIRMWEYINYIDIETATNETATVNAINNLKEYSNSVIILGSYPRFSVASSSHASQPLGISM